MGGREAIQRMREMPNGGSETVIIALTASTMGDERLKVLSEGANAFLRKPFREEELLEEIRLHTGVEFEYAEEQTVPAASDGVPMEDSREALALLPDALGSQLRSVIMRGAITEAKSLAEEVRVHDVPLAELILRHARDYQLNDLEALWTEVSPT